MALIAKNIILQTFESQEKKPVNKNILEKVITFRELKEASFPLIEIEQKKEVVPNEETHIRIKDGELERLFHKKSSYMMDLVLGSQ